MRHSYGWRALLVVALLALACKIGLAQIGPRYVLELPHAAAPADGAEQGRVQLAGKGLVLIRYQGLSILAVGADAEAFSSEAVPNWPPADLLLVTPAGAGRYAGLAPLAPLRKVPVVVAEQASEVLPAVDGADRPRFYPLHTWDALHLRKGRARLRVTALPGLPGTAMVAGFMLELGNGRTSYRVYVSCEPLEAGEIEGLPQRLPGADLALLPAREAPQLLAFQRVPHGVVKPVELTTAGYAFKTIKR